jgi:hypothetical protein
MSDYLKHFPLLPGQTPLEIRDTYATYRGWFAVEGKKEWFSQIAYTA